MDRNDAFSRCHPLVNFLYFALVLLGAMLLQHPVCQAISLIGAIACFCTLGGEKPGGFRLWYALALFAVTAAVNPAFSHEGRTIRRDLPSGNPRTRESILYGIGAGLTLGIPLSKIADALKTATGVKGRVEVVPTPGKPYTVLIDYSHTPDSLENVLKTVRGFCKGRVIAVFGCGGDRDPFKRPIMGRIGAELADLCVVTSDNPRTEDPMAIID